MSVVPTKTVDRIQFYEGHIAPWTTNATAIGTTTVIMTDVEAKTEAARAAYDAQQVAYQAAKAATTDLKTAMAALTNAGAAVIDQIRAKARLSGDSVYGLAEIPPPSAPGARQPPGTPSNLVAQLDGNGAVILRWKCNNPPGTSGTVYQVWRRIGLTGAFEYLGGVGQRKFVDDTISVGTTQVTYQIQAVRSTAVGLWAEFNVNFGTNLAGDVATTLVGTGTKLAA